MNLPAPKVLAPSPAIRPGEFERLGRLIAIDIRNLALLRIGLAILIMVDLAQRVPSLVEFCSDQGILTRDLNRWLCPPGEGFWSLYWLSGSTTFAAILLAINAASAVSLLLGWQTRWATLSCLILAYSLQIRMPLILTAGHILLRMLLFWSLFLPLGAVWSLDSWRRGAARPLSRGSVVSIASAAILLQVTMMYLFSGIAKWNEAWLRGEALGLALQLDMYVRPLGRELLAWPQWLMLLTFLTLVIETAGPFLLWMPVGNPQWRVSFLVVFWALHIGIWCTMSIGIFSAVAMLAWVVFLPGAFWSIIERWALQRWRRKTTANESRAGRLGIVPSIICATFLLFVFALNIAQVDPRRGERWFGRDLRFFGNATMVLQQFQMFDRPSPDNLWWRLVARNSRGEKIDVFPTSPERIADESIRPEPKAIFDSMPGQMWRRLLYNLATDDAELSAPGSPLHDIRLRAAIALWKIRTRNRTVESFEPVRFLCGRQRIVSDEEVAPIELETWATLTMSERP